MYVHMQHLCKVHVVHTYIHTYVYSSHISHELQEENVTYMYIRTMFFNMQNCTTVNIEIV